jgi:hypothetical protein
MQAHREATPDASWIAGASVKVLDQLIQHSSLSFACWHRKLPPFLTDPLCGWTRHSVPAFDEILSLSNYDLSGATQGIAEDARRWLMTDVALLLARFSHLANAPRLRVTFGAVRNDQCRKFHIDYVRYRMVTTYFGPGTEWVPDEYVSREALERSLHIPRNSNDEVVRLSSAVRRTQAGDVLVMKGARHEHGRGAVHRSPPLAGTGLARLVLTASTVNEP